MCLRLRRANELNITGSRCDRYLNPKGIIPATALYHKGQNAERLRLANAATTTQGEAEGPPQSDDEGGVQGEEEG